MDNLSLSLFNFLSVIKWNIPHWSSSPFTAHTHSRRLSCWKWRIWLLELVRMRETPSNFISSVYERLSFNLINFISSFSHTGIIRKGNEDEWEVKNWSEAGSHTVHITRSWKVYFTSKLSRAREKNCLYFYKLCTKRLRNSTFFFLSSNFPLFKESLEKKLLRVFSLWRWKTTFMSY